MSTPQLRARIFAVLAGCRSGMTVTEIARKLGWKAAGGQLSQILASMEYVGLVRADRSDPRRITWEARRPP